jgi:hypothetical protein
VTPFDLLFHVLFDQVHGNVAGPSFMTCTLAEATASGTPAFLSRRWQTRGNESCALGSARGLARRRELNSAAAFEIGISVFFEMLSPTSRVWRRCIADLFVLVRFLIIRFRRPATEVVDVAGGEPGVAELPAEVARDGGAELFPKIIDEIELRLGEMVGCGSRRAAEEAFGELRGNPPVATIKSEKGWER